MKQSHPKRWCTAALLAGLAAWPCAAETVYAKPGDALNRVLSGMEPGDTLVLAEGVYRGAIEPTRSGTTEAWITLRAAEDGKAVIDATGNDATVRHNGTRFIRLEGLVFRNAENGPQAEQGMVQVGSDWALHRCTIEGARGAGLGIAGVERVTIIDCVIAHNGQIGVGLSGSRDVLIKDTVLAHNNPGYPTRRELTRHGISEAVEHEGRWHVNPAWEAGGIKVCDCDDVTLDTVEAYDNHGPGLWADYSNVDVSFINCYAHDNKSVDEPWQGIGMMVEYNAKGPITVRGNRVSNNEGAGLLIAESRNVSVTDNQIIDDELEFRDMDRPEASLGEVEVTRNTFRRAAVTTSLGHWNARSAQTKGLHIQQNHWSPAVRYQWGDEVFQDLSSVQYTLGVELESVAENSDE